MRLLLSFTLLFFKTSHAFVSPASLLAAAPATTATTTTSLFMDMVTYLRTEWVSAALCTNQTPRAADVCLQLGVEDGRAITFIPRTIQTLLTSSAEADGKLTVAAKRQLKQQQERRQAAKVQYLDQRADSLDQTEDASVDVVISLQAAARMQANGQDWKRSIREAARVLKPGGRLLFVEQTELNGESYLEYVQNLVRLDHLDTEESDDDDEEEERAPIFQVGSDQVDLVLIPHTAGVAVKSDLAGMTEAELAQREAQEEQEKLAELSIEAYERGRKKRKKRKKKTTDDNTP